MDHGVPDTGCLIAKSALHLTLHKMSGCGGKPIPDQHSQMSVAVIPTQTLICAPAHTHTHAQTLMGPCNRIPCLLCNATSGLKRSRIG